MTVKSNADYRPNMSKLPALILIAATAVFSVTMATASFAEDVYQSQSSMIVAQNNAPSKGGQRPGPPPEEAISACQNLAADASCSFKDARAGEQVDGTCRKSPRGDAACVPNNAPAPRG